CVDCVEGELERHQHHHRVLAGDDPVDADREQDRGQQQELVEHQVVHRCPPQRSFRAMTMAPTRAASSSTDTISNGIRYCEKIESLTVAVLLPPTELTCRSAGRASSPQRSMSAYAMTPASSSAVPRPTHQWSLVMSTSRPMRPR